MAQTKRKRRTKHRGNAAGTVETRGRTGRKPEAPDPKRAGSRAAGRETRLDRPPTWQNAFMRGAIASGLLFILFQIGLGPDVPVITALGLAVFALVIYVPLGYFTDRLVYRRRMSRKAGAAGGPGGSRRAS